MERMVSERWFLYLNLKVVSKSDVCFFRVGSGDFSLVDDIFGVTVSIQRARVGFPAITVFLLIVSGCRFVEFSFVMIRYYCFDVTHAAIA